MVLDFLTYILLALAILSVWFSHNRQYWVYLLLGFLCAGALSGRISFIAWLPIFILCFFCYIFKYSDSLPVIRCLAPVVRAISFIAIVGVSLGLGLHLFPGFNNLQVLDSVKLTPDAMNFSYYYSYDKTVSGLFILAICINTARSLSQWKQAILFSIATALIASLVIFPLAMICSYVTFDPKLPAFFFWWVPGSFITCIVEEAFFRGLIQNKLFTSLQVLNVHNANAVALIVTSVLFGIAHLGSSMTYVGLAFLAGLAYGWAYMKTNLIESSILTHFLFNITHFLFFTYPALA